ncbi:hypothetical protein LSTR_LSTR012174 [Laodelphax striatellus]|uniref:Uncharacterized protein n=1 Tax=Laodelphax striatellus TaxID=195883 RepID=A0A482WYT3_LAOST|nr:hypothetical protein LSTR_LSTR012174 [Laodelphax striatellus]
MNISEVINEKPDGLLFLQTAKTQAKPFPITITERDAHTSWCSCFSAKKPETETGIFRELDYDLEDGQFHYKRISANDSILIVGEPPKDAFGEDYIYECEELAGELKDWHIKIAHTIVKIQRKNLQADAVDVSEYFVYSSMEIWECKKPSNSPPSKDSNAKDSPFLRVVSTLVSIKEIGAVQYYDTVEVSSVNYLENEATVKIKELKYIAYKDGRYFTVKYEGKVDLSLGNNPSASYPGKKEKLHPRQRGLGEEAVNTGFKKKWNLNEEFSFGLTVSSSGKTLFIDAPRKTKHFVIKEIYGDVKCLHLQGGDNSILPQHYKPQIYELLIENKNHLKYGEKDFSKYFTILERRVYVCKIDQHEFYEIQHEIVSRFEVRELLFTEHIDVVFVDSIALKEKRNGVRFKEIKRFLISTGEAVAFTGKENTFVHNPVAVMSSTFSHDDKIDIAFKLSALGDVYRHFISSEGYDLRIGSHYEASVETAPGEPKLVNCGKLKDYNDFNKRGELETKFKLKINKQDMTHATIRVYKPLDFFEKTSTDVWICQKNNILSPNVKFLRVVNKLRILKPVRYLETFDGIEIIQSQGTLQIIEIKYLDFANPMRVLSYRGKLTFRETESQQIVKQTQHKIATTAIQKTGEETVQLIGRNYDSRTLLMTDYPEGSSNSSETFSYSSSGITEIISMDFHANVYAKNDPIWSGVILCELMPDLRKLPSAVITSKSEGEWGGTIHELVGMDNFEEQSKYFESTLSEVWECQLPYQRKIYLLERKYSEDWMSGTVKMTNHVPSDSETAAPILDVTSGALLVRFSSGIYSNGMFPAQKYRSEFEKNLALITYPGKILTKTFEGGRRLFQIGSQWEEHLRDESQLLLCSEPPGSLNIFEKGADYIPRVVENVDGKMHRLDEDTLKDAFTISVRRVWLCLYGTRKVVRIFTALCATEPFLAISFHDGVKVEEYLMKESPTRAAIIKETIYIDQLTKKVLKYDGTPKTNGLAEEVDKTFCPIEKQSTGGVMQTIKKVIKPNGK